MACNTNRLNCTPEEVMMAASMPCGEFVNADKLQAEQLVYDLAYRDLINNHGINIDYYIKPFSLSAANMLYGEDPTAVFETASGMQMYVELSQDALALTQFGFDPGDEFTGFIHIDTFRNIMSGSDTYKNLEDVEPKSGDLVEITGLGCDRPGGRSAKIYEITERRDEDISAINPILGHYVYRIRAKRYEYSFEPNAPQESKNEQVFDDSQFGTLSTNLSADSVSDAKTYAWNIDDDSKQNVYDMDVNDTSIYGDYY
tara:strand:+ start:10435 stop:11205 length:771 start_codon:yes stop_codon:yes gene_type:complete